MGVLWFGGIGIYVIGTGSMGPSGKVAGEPVSMSRLMATASVNGLWSGAWKGAKTTRTALVPGPHRVTRSGDYRGKRRGFTASR